MSLNKISLDELGPECTVVGTLAVQVRVREVGVLSCQSVGLNRAEARQRTHKDIFHTAAVVEQRSGECSDCQCNVIHSSRYETYEVSWIEATRVLYASHCGFPYLANAAFITAAYTLRIE